MNLKRWTEGVEAVIFDLDGTLVDSMDLWTEIDIAYLKRFGFPFDPQLQKDIEGCSMLECAVYFKEKYRIPLTLERIQQDWIDMSLEKYRKEVPLKTFARDVLKHLKKRGVRTAIASSNGKEMIDAVLSAHDITRYFDKICCTEQVKRGKPYPDVYLYAAEKLGVDPGKCLCFEDIPAGIRSAKAAGMQVIAVDDPFSSKLEAEKRELADAFISDFSELGGILHAEN